MSFIQNIVKQVVQHYHSKNPYYIAEMKNIRVMNKQLPEHIRGVAVKALNQKYIILNQEVSENKRCFVCGHELGHHILHPCASYRFLNENTIGMLDRHEREANEFATLLLFDHEQLNGNDSSYYVEAKWEGSEEIIEQFLFR